MLLSCGGIYYAFFSCYLLLVAGLVASLRRRRAGPLAAAWLLIGVIFLGALANAVPTVCYRLQHGPNHEAVQRFPFESDSWGLRFIAMLIPVPGHRLGVLADLSSALMKCFPNFADEHYASVLGMAGSVGFLLLLGPPAPARDAGTAGAPGRPGPAQRGDGAAGRPGRIRHRLQLPGRPDDPRLQPPEHLHRLLRAVRAGPAGRRVPGAADPAPAGAGVQRGPRTRAGRGDLGPGLPVIRPALRLPQPGLRRGCRVRRPDRGRPAAARHGLPVPLRRVPRLAVPARDEQL
jgi:hypothetical protein